MTDKTLTHFLFEGQITVRVVERRGMPWFVMADVCRALGNKNPSDAMGALDDDEKGIASIYTPGGSQEVLVVSESGLSILILRCRDAIKPGTAPHRFRRWVTGEVLPAIRREGQYRPTPQLLCSRPEMAKVRLVEVALRVFGTQAAGELWFHVGLPTVPAMQQAPAQSDLFMTWVPPAVGGIAPRV